MIGNLHIMWQNSELIYRVQERRETNQNIVNGSLCRFQMLRQLIPNSDQKRDKASFLLEV